MNEARPQKMRHDLNSRQASKRENRQGSGEVCLRQVVKLLALVLKNPLTSLGERIDREIREALLKAVGSENDGRRILHSVWEIRRSG